MVMTTSTLNPEILRKNLKLVWGDAYETWKPEYLEIFEKISSNMNFERYQEVAGFGQVPVKSQGQDTKYFDPLNGYQKDITNISYGMGFAITREMMIYNQYNIVKRMAQALRQSVEDTIETIAANILNNAFDSTAFTLGDGVELCGLHTLPNGATFYNKAQTIADLAEASLQQAIIDIETNYVSGTGLKQAVRPKKLIVHPNDRYQASKLLNSAKVPETNNNAINPVVNDGLLPEGYAINHRLTDSNAFFVLTDHPDRLVCQEVVSPEFKEDNAFDSDNMKFKTFFIMAFGAYNPRCIYGNSGSN